MRFSIKKLGQRGATLVELVVALALLAILTTTSVLMCNSISSLVKYNKEVSSDIEDLTLTKAYIEKWFYTYDNENYVMSIDNNVLKIKDKSNQETSNTESSNENDKSIYISVSTSDDTVSFDYFDDTTNQSFRNYIFKGIEGIEFEDIKMKKDENESDTSIGLYKCIIKYDEKEFFFILTKNSK